MTTPMKKFTLTVDGVAYAIEILEEKNGQINLLVNGQAHSVEVAKVLADRPPRAANPNLAQISPSKPQPSAPKSGLTAPMPGDITEILVRPGDRVQAGDALCVLEAMKMKNTLRAAKAGVVAEVRVQPGQSVNHGELLIIFEENP